MSSEIEVAWQPLPGTSQELALSCPAQKILYHGTRACGKTEAQIARFIRNVGQGYGSYWKGIIFDREYKSLGDLIDKSKRMFRKIWTEDECRFLASNSQLRWEWATGEQLLFRTISNADDYDKYHGQEFTFLGWNELTKWETSECYDIMQSCNRSSFTPEKDTPKDGPKDDAGNLILLPPIPLENFATTNSYGAGHFWVKERFIANAQDREIVISYETVVDPATQLEVEVALTQCAIAGNYKENKYISPIYLANLRRNADPAKLKSWFFGSWDIPAGGAFDDLWSNAIHIVPRFKLPPEWRIVDRTYDDGGTHPYSVGWWTEANGEEVDVPYPTAPNQRYGANGFYKWKPVAGSLIQIAELYGHIGKFGSNKGTGESSRAIAQKINKLEFELISGEWMHAIAYSGPADKRIGSKHPDKENARSIMEAEGVYWDIADQSPGSRTRDYLALRDRLYSSVHEDGPGIYWMNNCVASTTLIPLLPKAKRNGIDIDDVLTTAEDHPYDMTRYRVQKGNSNVLLGVEMEFPA